MSLIHAEGMPHYLDDETDIFWLAIHPLTLVYTSFETPRRLYVGTYSDEDMEKQVFRTTIWAGAVVTVRALTGVWANPSHILPALLSGGIPRGMQVAGKTLGLVGSAFMFYDIFMKPGSMFYIDPSAPVFSMAHNSVFGSLKWGAARFLAHMYDTAL